MEIHFWIIGCLFIALALSHIIFPRYFNWKQELSKLSLVNRQIMLVHSFFIALMVLLIGLLCLTSAHELITTTLGKRISLGLGVFWGARLLIQLVGYSPKLWKGRLFETGVHIVFTVFWTYISVVFIKTYLA
ncbi:hypothetical protein A4H97_21690 [Niastella yeongjuensis]|uniref:Uncharacterized protein n=1 Tax=Niastella yeongjuensis TaxID=354355 RepID=A0A1V9F8D9_9BACT|nr:hypothetical protein [Niastella yeongjuensis]OQP54585.1 hypothetical protein A4H97_21690 [Niastella yeongjuensis]SEN99714.1 hypothetical protein SAMN05660816_01851 [Niastella yeongjuensis]